MSQMKQFSIGPLRLSAAAANYLNPPAASGGVGTTSAQMALVKRIRYINTDASTRTVTAYKGATAGSAGGTEIHEPTLSIPAKQEVIKDYYPALRFEATDFLSALADSANLVNIIIEGEIGATG